MDPLRQVPDELASLARMLRQGMSRKETAEWALQIADKVSAAIDLARKASAGSER